tara:strand:+ start:360 stop:671 length:312 start_codon:yes stop_codon:yes gene_type:complete
VDCSTLSSLTLRAEAHEHKFQPTLNNGHLTVCRLKKIHKRHDSAGKKNTISWWCLYEGANGSGFLEMVESHTQCPREVICPYDPKDKPPSIDDMLNAMKDAFK